MGTDAVAAAAKAALHCRYAGDGVLTLQCDAMDCTEMAGCGTL